jgi:hypothetical protein
MIDGPSVANVHVIPNKVDRAVVEREAMRAAKEAGVDYAIRKRPYEELDFSFDGSSGGDPLHAADVFQRHLRPMGADISGDVCDVTGPRGAVRFDGYEFPFPDPKIKAAEAELARLCIEHGVARVRKWFGKLSNGRPGFDLQGEGLVAVLNGMREWTESRPNGDDRVTAVESASTETFTVHGRKSDVREMVNRFSANPEVMIFEDTGGSRFRHRVPLTLIGQDTSAIRKDMVEWAQNHHMTVVADPTNEGESPR